MKRITAAELEAQIDARTVQGAVARMIDFKIKREGKTLVVHPVWADVDRPLGTGIVVPSHHVATRLVRAMRAGVVFHNTRVVRDVHGQSYVSVEHTVRARTLNADLIRLGF